MGVKGRFGGCLGVVDGAVMFGVVLLFSVAYE